MNAPARPILEPRLSQTSPSGIEVPVRVGPEAVDPARVGEPGQYPFTRGIFPDGYRGRLWTIRQYSGFGTAEESNQRYRFLLDQGQTGLSVALDLPTQCGYDPVDADGAARDRQGRRVAVEPVARPRSCSTASTWARSRPRSRSTARAAIIYAMYLAAADKQGVPRAKLTGTIQNDILKEYVARGTWIFPVRPSMRLIADSILYSNDVTPRFNPISDRRRARARRRLHRGRGDGLHAGQRPGLRRRTAPPRRRRRRSSRSGLSFFFYVHMDLFEEACKFRAGRRLWARLLRERYGVTDDEGAAFPLRRGLRRLLAGRGAAVQQHRARRDRDDGRGARRRAVDLHLRLRRGVPDPDRVLRRDRAAHAADRRATRAASPRTVDPLGGSYFVE